MNITTFFLSQRYVTLALIKMKNKIFGEEFITLSELNQFTYFMQQKIYEKDKGVVIVPYLDTFNFSQREGIITANDNNSISLDELPRQVYEVLTDKSLALEFFMELERKKRNNLVSSLNTAKSSKEDKVRSHEPADK